jgi:hypothetical protein
LKGKNPRFFFQPNELIEGKSQSILKIEAKFHECGEWGGHKEEITVIADNNYMFYAIYKVYPLNCDSLKHYGYDINYKPIVEKIILLNEMSKKSIVNYIHRLIESKMTEQFPGNAGNSFLVLNSDSSFVIKVYDEKEFDILSYNQLVTELTK